MRSGPSVSNAQRQALIRTRHRLVIDHPQPGRTRAESAEARAGEITAVVDDLVALHSSDPVTVYLSLLTRMPTVTVEEIADSLYRRRELVRVHGMRGTLWVGTLEVVADIVAASARRLYTSNRKRLAGFLENGGVTADGESWIDAAAEEIVAYVAEHGPCETRTIGDALPHLSAGFEAAPGKKYSAKIAAHTRVLLLLGFRGRIVRADPSGTWIASQYRWSTPEQWLGRPLLEFGEHGDEANGGDNTVEYTAQRSIIERYVRRFGPVTDIDIGWWTGWPLRVARRALDDLGAVDVELEDIEQVGWMMPDDLVALESAGRETADDDWVAVLPGLDPTTMGWKQRDWYVSPDVAAQLFDRNGNGGPSIWIGGRIVGGWTQRDNGELDYKLLVDGGGEASAAIEAKLGDLQNRLGETRFKVRFPSPLNIDLRR